MAVQQECEPDRQGGQAARQALTNVTLTASPAVFFNMDSPNQPKRFYRASLVT